MDILISSRPQYLSELDSNGWETPEDGSKGWSSGWGSTEDVIDAEWGAGREHKRPPLLVKLTGFRLLNMAVIMGLGVPKAVTSYQGGSAVPTTLDWVVGVFSASLLYWLGLYESIEPPVLVWFFHTDFSFTLVGPIVSVFRYVFPSKLSTNPDRIERPDSPYNRSSWASSTGISEAAKKRGKFERTSSPPIARHPYEDRGVDRLQSRHNDFVVTPSSPAQPHPMSMPYPNSTPYPNPTPYAPWPPTSAAPFVVRGPPSRRLFARRPPSQPAWRSWQHESDVGHTPQPNIPDEPHPAWQSDVSRSRKRRHNTALAPPHPPPPPPNTVPSWASWQPNPAFEYSPPPSPRMLYSPESGGLFGPRSPKSSPRQPSSTLPAPSETEEEVVEEEGEDGWGSPTSSSEPTAWGPGVPSPTGSWVTPDAIRTSPLLNLADLNSL